MAKPAPYPAKTLGEQPHSQSYGRGRGGYGEQPHSQSYGQVRGNYGFHHPWRGRGYPSRNQAEQQCYMSHSLGHISYHCPNKSSGGSDKNSNQATSGRTQVNCCTAVQRMPERVEHVVTSNCVVPIGESVCESV